MLSMHLLAISASAKPANIIFLLADDLRYDALGCNGNALVQTPNLDAMAADGVRFDNFYVASPICTASRANILTGLHAPSHKIKGFRDSFAPELTPFSYPYQLRQSGYWTAFAGKWGVGRTVPEGWFDRFDGFFGQGTYFEPNNPEHLDSRLARDAIALMDAAPEERPFCISISFKSPHADAPEMYPPDPAFAELYKEVEFPCGPKCGEGYIASLPEFIQVSLGRTRWIANYGIPNDSAERAREYHRLVASMDAAVGRIRAALAERGLAENTYVVFTSDNGYFMGEGKLQDKWLLYEESIKVPLLVCGPGVAGHLRGGTISELTQSIDIAPTFMAWGGAAPHSQTHGKSFASLVDGTDNTPLRLAAFFEHSHEPEQIPASIGIRTLSEKWIYYSDHAHHEYFHLRTDPDELINRHAILADEEQHARQAALDAWIAALDAWQIDAPTAWSDPQLPADLARRCMPRTRPKPSAMSE